MCFSSFFLGLYFIEVFLSTAYLLLFENSLFILPNCVHKFQSFYFLHWKNVLVIHLFIILVVASTAI